MHQTKKCTHCNTDIHYQAIKCKHCGKGTEYTGKREKLWSKSTAALLSLVPGLGHVYKKQVLAGVLWFICTSFAYKAFLLPGIPVHIICIFAAFRGNEYKQ